MSQQGCKIGKRSESRLRVRLPARLIALDFNRSAILCDLSESGARVECAGLPLPFCDLVLTWRNFEGFGRIKWSHSGESGISFYDPIPAEWLIATRKIDAVEHLKDRRELDRRYAKAWVAGKTPI